MPRWYVYRVNVSGVLAYIGKGTKGRFLVSAHRLNGIAGILEWFHKERDALKREVQLIREFNPPLNRSKGGEGKSQFNGWDEERREKRFIETQTHRAYKEADRTMGWRSLFFAACYARIELNSRGIRWHAEEPVPELDDPKAVEAIRRINAWKQSPLPDSLRSIICSSS